MARITLLTTLPLFLFLVACTPSASTEVKQPKKFDYGKATGNRYENAYFGLRFTAPSGWQQQQLNQEEEEEPMTADLFQVWQHPLESGAVDDANVLIFAERKNHNPATHDVNGYLLEMKDALKMIGHTDNEMSAIETVTLGGKPFGKMTITTHDEENAVDTRQEYYVRLIGEYWLIIIETTYHEDDKALIDQSLKTLVVD